MMAKLWVQSLLIYCICFVRQLSSTTYSTTTIAQWSELNQKHLVVLISEVGNSIKIGHATIIILEKKRKNLNFNLAKKYPVSLKIQRNGTGHVIQMIGASPLILDWLSRRYKFKYVIIFWLNQNLYCYLRFVLIRMIIINARMNQLKYHMWY